MNNEELMVVEGGRSEFEISLVGRIIRGEISGQDALDLLKPKGNLVSVEDCEPSVRDTGE